METQTTPVYYIHEAARFIHAHISPELQTKYSLGIITRILELLDDYYDMIGLNVYDDTDEAPSESSIVVDSDEISTYIVGHLFIPSATILSSEIDEILFEELRYCEKIGAVKLNNNN